MTDARAQLKSIVERIERLEEEKRAIGDDIKDVYAEAKGNGYDTKALRAIVRLRKLDADERREQEAVLETYMAALGMLPGGDVDETLLKPERKRAAGAQTCRRSNPSRDCFVVSASAGSLTRRTGALPGRRRRGSSAGICVAGPGRPRSVRQRETASAVVRARFEGNRARLSSTCRAGDARSRSRTKTSSLFGLGGAVRLTVPPNTSSAWPQAP